MSRRPLPDVLAALDAAYKTGAMPTDVYTQRRQWAEANADGGEVEVPADWVRRAPAPSAPVAVPGSRVALALTVLGGLVLVAGLAVGIAAVAFGALAPGLLALAVGAVGGGLLLGVAEALRLLHTLALRP